MPLNKESIPNQTKPELKELWRKKVTMAQIEIGVLSTITKGLVQVVDDLKIEG